MSTGDSETDPPTDGRPPEPAAADDPRVTALRELIGIVDRLRAPDGCPWDRAQTEESMAPCVVEEAHELVEAIEDGEAAAVAGEAGDVLLNVLLICKIAEQDGRFDLARAAELTSAKLLRRHPHVFGPRGAADASAAFERWEEVKRAERAAAAKEGDGAAPADTSALAGVPRAMPALLRALRVSAKAVAAGFRWRDVGGALGKVREELGELESSLPAAAVESVGEPELAAEEWSRIDHELGDLLMSTAFLASYLGRDPEGLCRRAVRRFEERFRALEAACDGDLQRDLDELEAAWSRVKEG